MPNPVISKDLPATFTELTILHTTPYDTVKIVWHSGLEDIAMKFSKRDTGFIKALGVARLATVSGEGVPHNIPVCPLFDRGKVYVASEKEARKVKNIKANPRATIVFDEYRDSWTVLRGIMLQCRSRIVEQKELKKIRRKLYSKYPKYESKAPIGENDSVIIELVPEKKFSWGFD